ncbi:IclR family transcriptional regulator [bacterium]|nr:MAG: IclR family transcriptional regulator [bacterium]
MGKREKNSYVIQAVASALQILEEFRGREPQIGLTDFANRLELHKNTAQRVLYTLESRGYVEQDRLTGNFRIGVRALELAHLYLRKTDILSMADVALAQIGEKCNETSYLGVLREGRAVYVSTIESTHPVRVVSRVGKSFPLHSSAIGKVLLAFRDREEAKGLIAKIEFETFTPHTIKNADELAVELEKIRKQGYALSEQEYHDGIRGVAAPVYDHLGNVVAAVSITGPVYRFGEERIKSELLPLVMEAAAEMSRRLGNGLSEAIR